MGGAATGPSSSSSSGGALTGSAPGQPETGSSGTAATSGAAVDRPLPTATGVIGKGLPGTADTSPITLGILDTGTANAAASAIGANYSTSTSGSAVTRAMVHWYNAHGGIAGRRIVPVEYTVDATSPSYQTQLEAACADFTQDHHVAATISVIANAYYADYEACLTKKGVPDFTGPTGGTDDHDLAAYPGMVSVTAPTTNRRFSTMLNRFADSGYLTPKDKVGVVLETCPYNERAWTATIAPLVQRLHLDVQRRDVACVHGFADAGAFISAVAGTVLPFRTAGVNRVLFVSNFEGIALLSFENNASSQSYAPSYALTSTTGGASLADQYTDAQMSRMRGVGWTPVLDVTRRVLASSTTSRCRAMLKSEGIQPASKADDLLDLVCDQFFLLEAALKAARGNADRSSLLAAVRSLGTSYTSAYTLSGATDYRTRRDGPRLFAIWGFKASCSCMDYLSAPSAD